jgi:hypothetical protein
VPVVKALFDEFIVNAFEPAPIASDVVEVTPA